MGVFRCVRRTVAAIRHCFWFNRCYTGLLVFDFRDGMGMRLGRGALWEVKSSWQVCRYEVERELLAKLFEDAP